MNWDAVGAVGEVVGAIGVIVSLLYLATQIRQSNTLERANAYRDFLEDSSSVFADLYRDPELHRLWRAGVYAKEALSEEDQERLGFVLIRFFNALNAAYHSSWLDSNLEDFINSRIDALLRNSVTQQWWDRQRYMQPEPFRSVVDARLEVIRKKGKVST